MRDAVASLSRMIGALRCARPMREADARWLADGAERWLRGDARSLEVALGLTAPGCLTAARIWAKEHRDGAILLAADCCGSPFGPNDRWSLAKRLAVEVERYGRRKRTAWAKLDAPPESATRVETALWKAYRAASSAGLSVPTSPEGLYRVIARI